MEIHEILESLKKGKISVNNAKKLLSLYSIEEVEGFAKIDINRRKRRGIPEVIFAETKELDEIKKITKKVLEKTNSVIISRIKKEDYSKISSFAKRLKVKIKTGKNSSSLLLFKKPIKFQGGKVGIMTAGTSDIGVAEESRLMCEAMNCKCITSYDVGVAGIQRVFPILKKMINEDVDCIIVAIIGVPTSVGYGYGEKGIAALASMLQSCSLGLSVVNIDNGIAAGGIAANIANRKKKVDNWPANVLYLLLIVV